MFDHVEQHNWSTSEYKLMWYYLYNDLSHFSNLSTLIQFAFPEMPFRIESLMILQQHSKIVIIKSKFWEADKSLKDTMWEWNNLKGITQYQDLFLYLYYPQ